MTIEIDINREDYFEFNKHQFIKTRLPKTILWGCLTILLVEYILNRQHFNATATIISSAGAIIVYILMINSQLKKSKNIPQEGGTILGKKTYEFNDTEIIGKDADSTTNLKWSAIKNIDKGKKAVYLYIDTNVAIVIPKRYFSNKDEQDSFLHFIKSKINAA